MIALAVVACTVAFPNSQILEKQVEENSPVKAVEFIKSSHLAGPMLNDYPSGGYLIWAAPEHPVMIDGRTDVYEWSGFLSEFGDWATIERSKSLLEKYKINFCLLNSHSPMVNVLPHPPRVDQGIFGQ